MKFRPAPITRAMLLALILVSCSTDGRTLAPALPQQNESVAIAPTETTIAEEEAFGIRGPWNDGENLDPIYTCFGDELSPPFEIVAQPQGTVAMAVLLYDVDSPEDLHWLVANIPGGTVAIGTGGLPPDVIIATNSEGNPGYQPPCPSAGERRQYLLSVFAMDAVIAPADVTAADGTVDADTLLTAVEQRAFDLAESTFYVQAP